jgi:3-hydroxyisobutyrate dehydrogenase-like beta-hydroxyacid dehydrogenase
MKIGILGSGLMGGKLGILCTRAGHDVVFSYARSQQKLKRLAREAKSNARAGTPADAVRDADAVLLAVHWLRIDGDGCQAAPVRQGAPGGPEAGHATVVAEHATDASSVIERAQRLA